MKLFLVFSILTSIGIKTQNVSATSTVDEQWIEQSTSSDSNTIGSSGTEYQMNENNDKLHSEQKINDTTSSAKILPWMGTDSDGSTVDSGLSLSLSADGKTVYVPGGIIHGPESIAMTLSEHNISRDDITKIVIENPLVVSGVASYLFAFLPNVQYIENIETVDVSRINSTIDGRLDSLFSGDINLQELNLSTWDLTNYNSDMSGMFYACWNLRKLVLGPNFKSSTAQ